MTIDFEELFRQRGEPEGEPPSVSRWPILLVAGFAVFMLAGYGLDVATEALWFDSQGQLDAFTTRVSAPALTFLAALLLAFAWLAGNWLFAARRAAKVEVWPGQLPPAFRNLQPRTLLVSVAGVIAFLTAIGLAANWETWWLAWHQVPFGAEDPILARDPAFYVFTLPALRLAQSAAISLVVTAFLGSAFIYVLGGLLSLRNREVSVTDSARVHLALLIVAGLLLWAASQGLGRYELMLVNRPGAAFSGPGYVDVNVRLPALALLSAAGVAGGIMVLIAALTRRVLVAIAILPLILLLQFGAMGVVPGLVQRYRVLPNELDLERPFISHNIAETRVAHGLDSITETEYDPRAQLTEETLERHAATVRNIRLWDWRVLKETFQQLQEIRPFYEFIDVDVDRYRVDEPPGIRQVELSPRELMSSQIRNRTWVNLHLAFTHGFGPVLAPVDEADSSGAPVLWIRDMPPVVSEEFPHEVTQPRIYFGEAPGAEYVIVGTEDGEFDYSAREATAADAGTTTVYTGTSGVAIGSRLRRLLFAMRFGDIDIMLADALTAESRIHFHRTISDRARTLAPFLTFDPDPYLVITEEGRMVWLYDAYTATGRYPYSEPIASNDPDVAPLNGNSYIRNSVKVAIDAYDGQPTFYVVDPSDPLIQAWGAVYPGLLTDVAEMPQDLVEHWRYPEALFRAQAGIYTQYHMTDPVVFYNGEDRWEMPTETVSAEGNLRIEPYYVTLQLRGETEPEFVLMFPFTPLGKPNMIAWMAARCDPPNYGELLVYNFDRGELVFGPEQIESRIDQDPDISQQLTLWSQRGSNVIRGNLLVIPLDDSILYVEPLYLQAERTPIPELRQVIVASGERVVMRSRLQEALAALLEGAPAVAELDPGEVEDIEAPDEPDEAAADATDTSRSPPTAVPTAPTSEAGTIDLEAATLEELVTELRRQRDAAGQAAARGDWRAFGVAMETSDDILDRIEDLTQPAPEE